ncbi:hypothetical protein P3T73_05650 [Kiritimatiellota bacterium B12222]|nr:hypothetical protein P3T73_05650 [Kiritimatiellota bacterium B12222]
MTLRKLLFAFLLFSFLPTTAVEEHFPTPPGVVPGQAGRAPIGKFFLLRRGEEVVAVKLESKIQKGDGGVSYIWYAQSDNSGSFTNESVKFGSGEVFENYRQKATDDQGKVLPSVLFIQAGPIKIEWSRGEWIYLNTPDGVVEIAFTDEALVENINFLDENLKWQQPKPSKGDPDPRTEEEKIKDEYDDVIAAYEKQLNEAYTRLYSAGNETERYRAENDVRTKEHILNIFTRRRATALNTILKD